MRLNLILLILIVVIAVSCSNNYLKISRQFDKQLTDSIFSDSTLKSLQESSTIILMSNIMRAHKMIKKDYNIIALQKGNWYRIKYFVKDYYTTGEAPYIFQKEVIQNKVADSILDVFVKNKFWMIKNTDEGCEDWEYKDIRNSCGRGGSVPHYQLILSYQSKQITKTYFQPEFYETECCPGNKDRQVFVKCYNAINSRFKNKL